MTDTLLLGRLVVANNFFCQLEPLAELSEGKWVKIDSKKSRFPKNGVVRANKSDFGVKPAIGSLWVFACVPSGIDMDQWHADAPARAQTVVDFSELSLAEARRRLLDSGIPLGSHLSRSAVVLLPEDVCCSLRFEPQGSLWVARLPEQVVELRKSDLAWTQSYKVDGTLFLPQKREPDGEILRRLDWSSDGDFLAKVVARYRAAVNGFTNLASKGGETPLRKLERALAEGKFGATDADDINAMLERLRAEWSETSRGLHAVETIGGLLFESDSGRRLLEEAVAHRVKELEVDLEIKARLEVEDRLAGLDVEFDGLREKIATESQAHNELQDGVASAKRAKETLEHECRQIRIELSTARETLQALRNETLTAENSKLEVDAALHIASSREVEVVAEVTSLRAALVEFADRARQEMESTGEHDASALAALAKRLEELFNKSGKPTSPLLPSAIPRGGPGRPAHRPVSI